MALPRRSATTPLTRGAAWLLPFISMLPISWSLGPGHRRASGSRSMTPARHAPNHASPHLFIAGRAAPLSMNLLYNIFLSIFMVLRRTMYRDGEWPRFVPRFGFDNYLNLRSKQPLVPSTQTTVLGQSIRAWSVSFSLKPLPARIKTQRSNGKNSPYAIRNTHRPPRFHLHRHNRHISVIFLQVLNGQP